MIVAFVGTIDEDESGIPITGNGKTCSMVGYLYNDFNNKREVWTNFKTDFSHKEVGFQHMINEIKKAGEAGKTNPNLVLGVTEMRRILDAIGSTTEQVLYIDDFAEQIRKLDCTLYYDTQRFNSIHKRLRIHTNVILIPFKTHMDDSPCYLPACMKPHKIFVLSHRPFIDNLDTQFSAIECFDSMEVGKHYDTKEFCKDRLIIPKKVKGEVQ